MLSITWKENNDQLIGIKQDGSRVVYTIAHGCQPVNEQQFNLPIGMKLRYSDGAYLLRIKGYYLMRNWYYNGKYYDRIAVPEGDVYLPLN